MAVSMNKRLLIVDDHPVNRRLPGMLLRDFPWQCSEAESGEAALIALRQTLNEPYDCVLLDISMPEISGIDVCAIIKASADLKHLRIIAYTAHAFSDTVKKIMAAGFDAILVKPITRKSLLAALEPENAASPP
jgi:putative two-component system response regulator